MSDNQENGVEHELREELAVDNMQGVELMGVPQWVSETLEQTGEPHKVEQVCTFQIPYTIMRFSEDPERNGEMDSGLDVLVAMMDTTGATMTMVLDDDTVLALVLSMLSRTNEELIHKVEARIPVLIEENKRLIEQVHVLREAALVLQEMKNPVEGEVVPMSAEGLAFLKQFKQEDEEDNG